MDDQHLSQIQTLWSLVERAAGDHTALQSVQQALLDRYGGAVHRYALAALRSEDAADDVFQEFALKFVRGDFAGADPQRGRFRAFVKTIVYRLIVDYQRKRKRQNRETPMHSNVAEPAAGEPALAGGELDGLAAADELFHTSWRDELLARSWEKLTEIERTTGKPHHTVLRCRADHPDASSAELAELLTHKLDKPTKAGTVRVMLHRAREVFGDALLEEITQSLTDDSLDAAEQELIEIDLLEYCRPAIERRRKVT